MNREVAAILLLTGIHIAGFAWFAWDMLAGEGWRSEGPNDGFGDDGGGGGGGGERPGPPDPLPDPAGGGLTPPLPDAEQSRVRLREPGRIAEQYPRPARRPEHDPAEPVRVPVP